MFSLLFILLPSIHVTNQPQVVVPIIPYISIGIVETWDVPYATDIQDLSLDWYSGLLIIRSNADGKLYLADPNTCEYVGEIDLPSGAEGFGVAFDQYDTPRRYYINSSISTQIFHSDGSDTWSEFPNPLGTYGAGIDFNNMMTDPVLFQASTVSPYQLYSINTDSVTFETYDLPGVNQEISGFTTHAIMTLSEPGGLILTTKYGHEFYFYCWLSTFVLYGQEPCPIPVSESLGLVWNGGDCVYWSYKGVDQEYYISLLQIDVFGGIDDEPLNIQLSQLNVMQNPSIGSVNLSVNLSTTGYVSLEVYDVAGRLLDLMHDGQLDSGESIFSFSGSPGVYIAVLRNAGNETRTRFILLN
ncbi:MAG: T9SS type A sorting domain-containing protein [Candidatus Aegiribacteria sp.]|nr:T9SS type A sorting domain-containing protein [Candidatus Aegiribacteria sp.]